MHIETYRILFGKYRGLLSRALKFKNGLCFLKLLDKISVPKRRTIHLSMQHRNNKPCR